MKNILNSSFPSFFVATISLFTLATASSHAQLLIAEYRFNDTAGGTSAVNIGSAGGNATLTGAAVISSNGLGVSGLAGDRAMDNTAVQMGVNPSDPGGRATQSLTIDSNSKSGTFVLWFNADSNPLATNARLIGDSPRQQILFAPDGLQLQGFGLGARTAPTANISSLNDPGEWVFLAITFDAIATSNNINVYSGSTTGAVSLISTLTDDTQVAFTTTETLSIAGSTSDTFRPFEGYLDNVRIYAANDASGALGLTDLESLRQLDVIPEPASTGLFLMGTAILMAVRRRSR
jgi:hypothetical protein